MALINSGDRVAARAYVEKNFSDDFRRFAPIQRHLDLISMMHAQSRGMRVESVVASGPAAAEVRARSELTEQSFEFAFEVEPTSPHRISGIRFRPVPSPAGQAVPRARTDAELVRALDRYVRRLAEADAFSGVVLLAKEGRPLLAVAYGQAERTGRRSNTVETAFNLASMNKMITAVAIAQLVEAGKLSFDDPVGKYLPNFPNPRAAQEIRIKHLLSHTAGLGSHLGPRLNASQASTLDEMMRFATDTAAAFAPGTRWRYSNTGFLVLGKVIEQASGKSYFDYVRDHIYTPAGMRSTDFPTKDRLPANAAIGYDRNYERGEGAYDTNITQLPFRGGPAGGGYSSARDLLRFAEALRSGRLVSPAMVRVLTSPKPELASPAYGYGFASDPERRIAGHSGGYPGITNNIDLFLDGGYTGIVLSNHGMSGAPIFERIRSLVGGPAPAPTRAQPQPQPRP